MTRVSVERFKAEVIKNEELCASKRFENARIATVATRKRKFFVLWLKPRISAATSLWLRIWLGLRLLILRQDWLSHRLLDEQWRTN